MSQSPRRTICPNTVLLFELGCAHPALRVTGNIEIIEKEIEEPKSRLPDLKKRLPSKINRLPFFSARRANFVTTFTLIKNYKPENPSGWHYLLDELSPEMDSNPNLNGWTSM